MASADTGGMIGSVKRLVNRTVSGTNFLTNTEITLYMQDAAHDLRLLISDFTAFTISGSVIDPAPDVFDRRLIEWGTACLVSIDDDLEAAGDAILIKAGSITLDTSKSVRGLSESTKRLCATFMNFVDKININGKDGTGITGTRLDSYIEDLSSTKNPESLI